MTDTCESCKHFWKLGPGHAGICSLKQRGREWSDGIAVVSEDDTCDDHEMERLANPRFQQDANQ